MTITAILAAILAALGTAVAAYFKGVRAGRNSEIVDRSVKDANTRREFDAIDDRAPDLDDAVARLRKRAVGDGRASSE